MPAASLPSGQKQALAKACWNIVGKVKTMAMAIMPNTCMEVYLEFKQIGTLAAHALSLFSLHDLCTTAASWGAKFQPPGRFGGFHPAEVLHWRGIPGPVVTSLFRRVRQLSPKSPNH